MCWDFDNDLNDDVSRLLCEDDTVETPTTPTNEGYRDNGDAEPHIPEPDYDMSDQDNDNNIYSNGGDNNGGTATLRRRGRSVRSNTDTERKKKKTVSFIMNEKEESILFLFDSHLQVIKLPCFFASLAHFLFISSSFPSSIVSQNMFIHLLNRIVHFKITKE